MWNQCEGLALHNGLPRLRGSYRYGEQGRFGGAQRPRNRLVGIAYLDTFDHDEFGARGCVYALKRVVPRDACVIFFPRISSAGCAKTQSALAIRFHCDGRYGGRYDTGHDMFRARVMTRLWRNSLEVAVAATTIVLGTLIVHLVISWWSAMAALH